MPIFAEKKSNEVELNKIIYTAKSIWDSNKDILYCNEFFYKWNGRIYEKMDKKGIEWMIFMSNKFPALNEFPLRSQKEIMEVYKRFSKIQLEDFNSKDGLCFNNKYVDFSDISTHDHDSKRLNTILITYDYDEEAKCPLWIKTIKEIFEGDVNKIISLQEFFGYCLTRKTNQKKAMFLFGDSDTGKSVILETLENMIGKDNISIVSLKDFSDGMRLAALHNKLANISTEVPKRAKDFEEIYKKVTSGERIEANPKYESPFKFRPFCKMIFALNQWPRIDDQSSAFFNRMLIIELEKIFSEEEQDKDLTEKLAEELPGILNWSVIGLKRLREKNRFTKNEYMKQSIKEVKMQNNPVALYASENLQVSEGSDIVKAEVYKKYSAWCGTNGYKAVGSNRFGVEIYRIFKASTGKDNRRTTGDRDRVWVNVGYKYYDEEQVVEWNDQK